MESTCKVCNENLECFSFNLLALEFFLILAHPVYKKLIIQEASMLEL